MINNDWYGKGMPPIGTKCQGGIVVDGLPDWIEGTVVTYGNSGAVGFHTVEGDLKWCFCFKPLTEAKPVSLDQIKSELTTGTVSLENYLRHNFDIYRKVK